MSNTYEQPPASPCNNECVVDYSVGWCRACYRTLREIATWASMTPEQKREVMQAIAARRGDAQ